MNKNSENNAKSVIKSIDRTSKQRIMHTAEENNTQKQCLCAQSTSTGLFVPNRELSYCVAIGLLGLFFVFMAGFFWGQQYAIKDFLQKINQDSFADQVASSLYVFTDTAMDDMPRRDREQELEMPEPDTEMSDMVGIDRDTGDEIDKNRVSSHAMSENEGNSIKYTEMANDTYSQEQTPVSDHDTRSKKSTGDTVFNGAGTAHEPIRGPIEIVRQSLYYAQLIGFGTSWAAHQFVNHITKKGFSAKVEKRVSKTTKGKKICWYQVVTDMYTDKAYLEDMVTMLIKQEKLKGVRILSC